MESEMNQLLELFRAQSVSYKLYEHQPVYTSEQASKVRNVELKTGVKSMVVRTRERRFLLANLAADRKIDFEKLDALLNTKHSTLATREEVLEKTHCEPGSVHPIGRLFGLETYLDRSVLENKVVTFNIGLLTRSVQITIDELLKVMQPNQITEFSRA